MQQTLLVLTLLAAVQSAATKKGSYKCMDFDVPISFSTTAFEPNFPPFQNHYESVAFLDKLTARNGASYSLVNGNHTVHVDITVAAQYCTPSGKVNGTVQILSHGLGFDGSYWNFGGRDSQYNYIKAATDAGYAVLNYDRIGTGKSTKTDPYYISQLSVQVEVLRILTERLRNQQLPHGAFIPRPGKIAHVGHSYGSLLSSTLVAGHPNISDGLVLTGFNKMGSVDLFVGSNFHLARENMPGRFGNLSAGYVTWGDELANQLGFFHWPNFSAEVLAQAEATKWPFAVGEVYVYFAPFAGAQEFCSWCCRFPFTNKRRRKLTMTLHSTA